jgi:transcriptional regulator with XRE-family HTH domain
MTNYNPWQAYAHLSTYGRRVRFLREQRDMLQKELREALIASGNPMSAGYSSGLENGDQQPTGEIIAATARILGTSTDFLLMMTDDPTPVAERRAEVYQSAEMAEAAQLIDGMDKPHRDLCMSVLCQVSDLNRAKNSINQYRALAEVMFMEIEKSGGEDALSKTLTMLESRLPGASAVALRLRREQTFADGRQEQNGVGLF